MTCGLRRSELLGLAADALELDAARPTLTVKRVVLGVNHQPIMRDKPKSKSSGRTLEIPASLVALLRAQLVRVRESDCVGRGVQTPAVAAVSRCCWRADGAANADRSPQVAAQARQRHKGTALPRLEAFRGNGAARCRAQHQDGAEQARPFVAGHHVRIVHASGRGAR